MVAGLFASKSPSTSAHKDSKLLGNLFDCHHHLILTIEEMLVAKEQIGNGANIDFTAASHREDVLVCFGCLEDIVDLSILFDKFLALLLLGLD